MSQRARFSKIEIAVLVLLWAVVLVLIFGGKQDVTTLRHASESLLKGDLQTMRMAIENYTLDKRRPPDSLHALVDEKYLPALPTNPFTRKADWVPHYVRVELDGGQVAIGIDNVHASPPYSDW